MSGTLETNKNAVLAFLDLAFNAKKPEQAARDYLGSTYTQHNPQAADGAEAFIQFVSWFAGQFPALSFEVKRVVAEGDLVVTHGVLKTSASDRGTAAADVFRLANGKIVEHWDVLQPIPETSLNDNPMV